MRYEYKTEVLTGGFMGRHKEELNRPALDARLAELGREGWELCWTLLEQALHHEKDGHVLIFKRPMGEADAPAAPYIDTADCAECGEPLREGARFCGVCGTPTGD